ncbi:MAG: M48 family metallopeptidase [Thermotogota bacterium]
MKAVINLNDLKIKLRIKNITKKSIKLYFSENKELIIHKPKYYSLAKVNQFIYKNKEKILSEYNRVSRNIEEKNFHYLGKKVEFKEIYDDEVLNCEIEENNQELLVKINKKVPQNILTDKILKTKNQFFYSKINNIILFYKEKHNKNLGLKINSIKIKNLKSRWGSCSTKKNLNFNVKLICFSEDVIEYVVVHEMCHFIYMNHSKDFWKEVEKILPDYKERKNKLNNKIIIPELLR